MANIFSRLLGGYVGAYGHGLQQLGTMLKAPQIVPGGLGAQMQIAGRQLNPFNPPAAKGAEPNINWQPMNIAETYQQYAPGDTTSGGGGGDGGDGQVLGTQSGDIGQQSGSSYEDQLKADLEAIFSPIMSYLGGAESTLGTNYGLAQQDIESQYGISKESLATEKAGSTRQLETQETEAGKRKEDALTAATRLYGELTKGGVQRFGGASSAGEAFQSLTATEQQRRQGSIYDAYNSAIEKVGQYKVNLEEKYTLAVKDLEVQKNSAFNQVRQDYNNNLLQISQMKAEAESNKAQMRLQALQDLRNKVYAINLQSMQFAQQLALNKQASLSLVDQYTKQALSAVSSGQTTVSNTLSNYNPTSAYSNIGGTTGGTTTTPYIGQISGGKRWDGTQWVTV